MRRNVVRYATVCVARTTCDDLGRYRCVLSTSHKPAQLAKHIRLYRPVSNVVSGGTYILLYCILLEKNGREIVAASVYDFLTPV